MSTSRVHAFADDALGSDDTVALTARLASGEVSAEELAAAAVARARQVDPVLRAVAHPLFDAPRYAEPDAGGALRGVPTFVKDNTPLRGLPASQGSRAFVAHPAARDDPYTRQFLSTGVTVLGSSRLPEFGFNASTEFATEDPVRNPWHTGHSVGASSGGAAALVASGVVPLAHGNDGGGSLRIPAACAGLVGLKVSRGRNVDSKTARQMPIHMMSEGVLTRTVRDTAAFWAASEDHWRNPKLPPIGLVRGPAERRLRIGMVLTTVTGATLDAPTRAAVEDTARLLEQAGHLVEPIEMPVTEQFADDFLQYWSMLADLVCTFGKITFGRSFDARKTDGLTRGLRRHHRSRLQHTPGALLRLRRVHAAYARMFARHELVLSPVLAHTPPELGWLSPNLPFEEVARRLLDYVAYTPLNNVAGTPAISLPATLSPDGLPVGVELSAAYGDERTLLEVGYALEEARPFPGITG